MNVDIAVKSDNSDVLADRFIGNDLVERKVHIKIQVEAFLRLVGSVIQVGLKLAEVGVHVFRIHAAQR